MLGTYEYPVSASISYSDKISDTLRHDSPIHNFLSQNRPAMRSRRMQERKRTVIFLLGKDPMPIAIAAQGIQRQIQRIRSPHLIRLGEPCDNPFHPSKGGRRSAPGSPIRRLSGSGRHPGRMTVSPACSGCESPSQYNVPVTPSGNTTTMRTDPPSRSKRNPIKPCG